MYNPDDSTRRLGRVGLTLCATDATVATFVVTLSHHASPRRHEAIVVEAPPTYAVPVPRSSPRLQRVGENCKLEAGARPVSTFLDTSI